MTTNTKLRIEVLPLLKNRISLVYINNNIIVRYMYVYQIMEFNIHRY